MVNEAPRDPQRWVFGGIAVYVSDYAVATKVYQSLIQEADKAERMGVYILDNGDRVAWVRLQQKRKGDPEQK
jgi:hypothetical protein